MQNIYSICLFTTKYSSKHYSLFILTLKAVIAFTNFIKIKRTVPNSHNEDHRYAW